MKFCKKIQNTCQAAQIRIDNSKKSQNLAIRIANLFSSPKHNFPRNNNMYFIVTFLIFLYQVILYRKIIFLVDAVKYPPHSGVEGNLCIFPPEKASLQQLPRKVTSTRAIKAVTCSPYTDGNEDKRNESYAPKQKS
ncbi:hypothetical protein EDEG_02081 [Edhazardia aedis USNM 41457]|uniref:Uncharacterized protein n=1 Tax=Edhazardia aedis (strain USNM 41457) TaxID=1003232 RepID=J9D744_EDHAE|nr:hypothetical protein EDEG_02081 [Edhazardia aedis USNM 41457]|eukprot:EJW03591.1 hypothetical protein EDEG_02081 [Edhazardia aedis USNM 41457]